MKSSYKLAALAATLLLGAGQAAHASTTILYNTGYDASGNEIALGTVGVDAHWTLTGGTGTGILSPSTYASGVNGQFPIGPWVSDDTTSRWITPSRSAGDSFDPNQDGDYQYSQTFDLTSAQAASAFFTGQFAADNRVTSIALNGVTIYSAGTGPSDFTGWTSFGDTNGAGFQSGTNTLTFDVVNYGQNGGNPTGLDVQFLTQGAGGVPEPATWAMMIMGLGLVGAALRRRGGALAAA